MSGDMAQRDASTRYLKCTLYNARMPCTDSKHEPNTNIEFNYMFQREPISFVRTKRNMKSHVKLHPRCNTLV